MTNPPKYILLENVKGFETSETRFELFILLYVWEMLKTALKFFKMRDFLGMMIFNFYICIILLLDYIMNSIFEKYNCKMSFEKVMHFGTECFKLLRRHSQDFHDSFFKRQKLLGGLYN